MNDLFLLLVLLSLLAICISVITPRWAMPWDRNPGRLKGIGLYGAATVVFFVGFGLTMSEDDPGSAAAQSEHEEVAARAEDPETPDENTTPEAQPEQPQRWLEMDKSEEAQQERWSLIESAVDSGFITKVEKPARFARIYTGPRWAALQVDDKQSLANMVATYFFAEDPDADIAIIRDGYTGKDIGRLDSTGLTMH